MQDEGTRIRPKSRMYASHTWDASRMARGDNRRFVYARKIRPDTAGLASDVLSIATADGGCPMWVDMLMAATRVLCEQGFDYSPDESEYLAAEAMELWRRALRAVHRDPLERELWERDTYASYCVERSCRQMQEVPV
jgi:hypothetical protein